MIPFQARTRERLTELLACYGQKRLPKSPSVSICMNVNEMIKVCILFHMYNHHLSRKYCACTCPMLNKHFVACRYWDVTEKNVFDSD